MVWIARSKKGHARPAAAVLALALAWPSLGGCAASANQASGESPPTLVLANVVVVEDKAAPSVADAKAGQVDAASSPAVSPPRSTASDAATAAEKPAPASTAVKANLPRTPPRPNQTYVGRDDVLDFAHAVASSRGLQADAVMAHLAQARFIPAVAKLMMPAPAGTAKDWAAYRARFVEPKRIAAGVDYWRANQAWLEQAQSRWGVPASIVVGVIGVETFYGRVTGSFRVLDALSTLSFDFPTGRRDRTPFFRAQLEEFLHWCEREGVHPTSVLGSYAGAMGLPQFMPTSIASWAVDFDKDGRVDLARSHADVVGSVAHYLAAHGWQRDMPAYHGVTPPADEGHRAALLAPDIVPTFSAAQMTARGATLAGDAAMSHAGPLALIELQNGASMPPSYVAGTENFYVVTRYNWSSYYAMAVVDLGAAVAREVESQALAQHAKPLRPGAHTVATQRRSDAGRGVKRSTPRRTVARAP